MPILTDLVGAADTINFNTLTPDATGVTWLMTEWDGWDSPTPRQGLTPRTQAQGGDLGENLYEPRAISMKGIVKCPTEALFWSSRDRLAALTDIAAPPTFVVHETVNKQAVVYRHGKLHMKELGSYMFEFELPMIALDPRKYASIQRTDWVASRTIINNTGDYASAPVLQVNYDGADVAANPVIFTNNTTGKSVRILTALTAGDRLIIDVSARTVILNGVNRFDLFDLTLSRWWDLIPGNNSIDASAQTRVNQSQLVWRPAWV